MYFFNWKFCVFFKVVIAVCGISSQPYMNCSDNGLQSCPKYSSCTKIGVEHACVCEQNYVQNLNWGITDDKLTSQYCVQNTNGTKIYVQQPAKPKDVALGILMVLFLATFATAILYLLKVCSPITRAKYSYQKLNRRRQNIQQLQELDVISLK
ncbi:uncharacterized protein LOC119675813 [Teleopsis dalmanni]|uniref:uncharacterized protein LOC119675813 n=1 Tax=Teleopsis dalmanni TaxID=139649 RepID=UPI0018CFBDC7|nr:uncharacterized protein LOC119675813 [Teleopsis dalmanni]